jgi:hypothetical protein
VGTNGAREAGEAGLILHAMIREVMAQGERDPGAIARRILSTRTADSVGLALSEAAEYLIKQEARLLVGNERRQAFNRAIPGATRTERAAGKPLLQTWAFLPNVGWREIGSLTAVDCWTVAEAYRRRADTNAAYAELYEQFAVDLERAGAETLYELEQIQGVAA